MRANVDGVKWLLLAMLLFGCGGGAHNSNIAKKGLLEPEDDARSAYGKALLSFRVGDCTTAEPTFRDIRRVFPYTRFAALSELRIGDCQFNRKAFAEAIRTYRQFMRIRPSHREIAYARFRVAEAHYRQIPSGWFLTPPSYQRDQTATRESLIQLRRFVVDFPNNHRVPDAHKLMSKCMNLLAAHELYIARFYFRKGAYRGAMSRIQGLLSAYPGSTSEAHALLILGRAYLYTKQNAEARQALLQLVAQHPKSREARQAQFLLD